MQELRLVDRTEGRRCLEFEQDTTIDQQVGPIPCLKQAASEQDAQLDLPLHDVTLFREHQGQRFLVGTLKETRPKFPVDELGSTDDGVCQRVTGLRNLRNLRFGRRGRHG